MLQIHQQKISQLEIMLFVCMYIFTYLCKEDTDHLEKILKNRNHDTVIYGCMFSSKGRPISLKIESLIMN